MKLLVAAILLTAIAGIAGLECYTCTLGSGGPGDTSACGDPFNAGGSVPKTTCTDGLDVCVKVTSFRDSQNVVGRTCFASAECPKQNACANTTVTVSGGEESATVCCCSGNLCNGAGLVTVSVITTMVVVVMAMVFSL